KFEGIVDIAQGVNGLRVFCQSADIKKIEAELGDFHSQHGGFMSETLDNYITDTLRTRHYALPVSLINGLIGEKDAQSVYRSHQAEAKHDLR
ncbi:MAG: hypothetical protein RSG77_20645, partial [Hafnia sp.]